MDVVELPAIVMERTSMSSRYLDRDVFIDIYSPKEKSSAYHLLFINDGQDLEKMPFAPMLNELVEKQEILPLIGIGIHAGPERKMEYGTAKILDFMQRGAKSGAHHQFVLNELLPFLHKKFKDATFSSLGYAGFSLGGLSAIDAVWNHPEVFSIAGVFSGSLWWRSKDLHEGYNEDTDRIMHQQVKKGKYSAGLRFYFTTGSLDETADRNNNGIIDSIDDTLGLIEALKKKGYSEKEIRYINFEDGKHDVETWGRAMPDFLRWGWGEPEKGNAQYGESC